MIRLTEGGVAMTAGERSRPVDDALRLRRRRRTLRRRRRSFRDGCSRRFGRLIGAVLHQMNAAFVVRTMVTLTERRRAVGAGERFGARVQQQMRLQTARIAESFAADETDVVAADQTLAHQHVVEVAIVTQHTCSTPQKKNDANFDFKTLKNQKLDKF